MKKILISFLLMSFSVVIVSAQIDSEFKIIELKKIITLSSPQEIHIRKFYDDNSKTNDSILYHVQDPNIAAQMKYDANRICHEGIMNVLTNNQKIQYIRVTSTPEINAKTEAKIQNLRESNQYSEAELETMRKETFEYLMLEKVVYARDKYKINQQKENIRKLKQFEPNSLKESNSREKLKGQGKINRGNVNW